MNYEIIKFENGNVELEIIISVEEETVYLSKGQMTKLFRASMKETSSHIEKIFKEMQLDSTFYKTILEEKRYNLDAVLAVGYSLGANNCTIFRRWAESAIQAYSIKEALVSDRYYKIMNKLDIQEDKIDALEERLGLVTYQKA